jgi:hypothetical protein
MRPGARVPIEHVGRARDLRRRLLAVDPLVEAGIRAVQRPLDRRLKNHPVLRRDGLQGAMRGWDNLPRFGRLASAVDIADIGNPHFVQLRCVPAMVHLDHWREPQPGVAIVVLGVVVRDRRTVLVVRDQAAASLHSLARRYQRGRDTSDIAILAELGEAALLHRPQGDRFGIAVAEGSWLGHVEDIDDRRLLMLDTFVGDTGKRRAGKAAASPALCGFVP